LEHQVEVKGELNRKRGCFLATVFLNFYISHRRHREQKEKKNNRLYG
jgi:hypothetical protein